MIADAVDTLITLGRALAAHDTITVPAYLAMVVAIAALLCGHQGQPWPLTGLRAACRRGGPRTDTVAPLAAEHASRASESIPRPKRRPAPSWAHTEPYTYEGAA